MEKKFDLRKIPGVGDKIAKKLEELGLDDPSLLVTIQPEELANIADIGEGIATKIINATMEMLGIGFETAAEIEEKMKNSLKITTSSKKLDELLDGGVPTQLLVETYGPFASGKTQLGFQLAVNVQLPIEEGGLGRKCVVIDSENTFSPKRIKEIAQAAGLNPKETIGNIYVARAFNSSHQIFLVEKKLPKLIEEKNVGLIIVDSLTSHFRADFIGRGMLADRQQKLNRHLHILQRLADAYNLAVYMTNQVQSDPSVMFGDPTKPVGGNVLGHMVGIRLYLRKSKGNKRIATLKDCSYLPPGEVVFQITREGIRDIE